MAYAIDTLVWCDGCNYNCNGDDRTSSLKTIREGRKLEGWRQHGHTKDYCPACGDKIDRGEPLPND